ncbi:phosphonate C-P lyase system protein PhnH [Rhizobium halophilum]|uniref:phosphonate C-P lyase system protein PhnH n=1 Tax=Rhizobium halophilum TaxID=2846852 RepID=UPI001EFDB166|nr:phosphonate C-P lyase system protein PhnH [Rhizobium halophilum]MCF6369203.1 phosphonate C-P lyase system protein PhnH [Rhizobium halophilum]
MSMNAKALSGGFAQPVFDAQAVFRLLMDGMSRPGTHQTVGTEIGQPSPLGEAAGAIALALCDADTPVWLQSSFAKSAVADWIAFHTGAAATQDKSEAKFAFKQAGAGLCSFDLFSLGTQEYPDRSTTIIIEVAAIGEGRSLVLSGPGIKDSATIKVTGLPEYFEEIWRGNRALFPRGVDVILTAGRTLVCLPRTTTIA